MEEVKVNGLSMQAVILAGGLGTRLRPITNSIPKVMVLVNGKPFLQHQMEYLKRFGLNNFLIFAAYLGEKIQDYFGDGTRYGLNIEYSFEKEPMGTAGALKNAERKLEDTFLLLNGDTLMPIDYESLIRYFSSRKATGLMVAYSNLDRSFRNNATIDSTNTVTNYSKKDLSGMTHVDAGVYMFRREVTNLIPANRGCSLEQEIFPLLIARRELIAYPSDQRFYDMGSFEGLDVLKEVLR